MPSTLKLFALKSDFLEVDMPGGTDSDRRTKTLTNK